MRMTGDDHDDGSVRTTPWAASRSQITSTHARTVSRGTAAGIRTKPSRTKAVILSSDNMCPTLVGPAIFVNTWASLVRVSDLGKEIGSERCGAQVAFDVFHHEFGSAVVTDVRRHGRVVHRVGQVTQQDR